MCSISFVQEVTIRSVPEPDLVVLSRCQYSGLIGAELDCPHSAAIPHPSVIVGVAKNLGAWLLGLKVPPLGGISPAGEQLLSIVLPDCATHLAELYLGWNQLMSLTLPESMSQLSKLDLYDNGSLDDILSEGWLSVPDSISDLWVRFGSPSDIGPYPDIRFTWFGVPRLRFTDVRPLEDGASVWTVSGGKIGEQVLVESSQDLKTWEFRSWFTLYDRTVSFGVLPDSEIAEKFYRLSLRRPGVETGWSSYSGVPGSGGCE